MGLCHQQPGVAILDSKPVEQRRVAIGSMIQMFAFFPGTVL